MTDAERVEAELQILGLDVTRHVVDFHADLLDCLAVTRSRDLLGCRTRATVLVAGTVIMNQTPPVRSGRRVIFTTLDDATGPIDIAFFDDVQHACATTVLTADMLLVRGITRRTGPRGISIRATACWDLDEVQRVWRDEGLAGVHTLLEGDRSDDRNTHRGVAHNGAVRHPYLLPGSR